MSGKRIAANRELAAEKEAYSIAEAAELLGRMSAAKFEEGVDVAIRLGIDIKQSDQQVRGSATLPHGHGRAVRIAVIADGDQAEAAKAAGADRVGVDDLIEEIKAGKLDFDVLIATKESMRMVGQLGKILGPRNLMPNPKEGTVTSDAGAAVAEMRQGQMRFRSDKAGVVHGRIGKLGFSPQAIAENLQAVIGALNQARPSGSKGVYLRSVSLSSSMGPGLAIQPGEFRS